MEFLSSLKVGSMVGVVDKSNGYPHQYRTGIIERETPKFLFVDGRKYSKTDGRCHGDRDFALCSLPDVEKGMAEYEKYQLRKKAKQKEQEFRRYAFQLSCEYSEEFVSDFEALLEKHTAKQPTALIGVPQADRLRYVF